MAHALIDELLTHPVTLTDGAWGTQLQAQGLEPGEFPDAWNLFHPERVEAVARAYAEAGSQIVLTNTFGANRLRLQECGLQDQAAAINRAGVEISRRAVGDGVKVFASIGPTGKMLMTGETSEQELKAVFTEQAQALAEGGPDGLVVETMSDLAEAVPALTAARATGLPVVACMVYDSGKEKDRTMMGTTPEQAARALTEAGADVIGANCGQGVAGFVSISRRLREATDLPIWIKANAGLPEQIDGKTVYHTTAEEFAGYLPLLREAGARFVGGCCGTDPNFIRALRRALHAISD